MKFFSLENPIWKFIGNLADFFLLSCLWYLCCLPVVTAGAATTALYYVTLKMARGQEGQLIPAFFHSFKQNLKQATALWVGYLAVGILLVLDLVICLQTSSVFAGAMFFTSVVLLACWALFITMLFPLVARCDNTIGALFKMGIAMALRCMNPQILVCDELGTAEDAQAVAQGVASGVVFFATVHCDTPAGLHKKPPLAALLATGAFAKAAFLSGRAHPGTVAQWVTL